MAIVAIYAWLMNRWEAEEAAYPPLQEVELNDKKI